MSETAGGQGLHLIERSVYRGPNLFGMRAMIRLQIDLRALEDWPSDRLPGFVDRLLLLLPGLAQHGCSIRSAGGFERRLREGTWLGHVIEHVALELQTLAGHAATRGKTRSVRGRAGVYDILYVYQDEKVGLAAGAHAIALVAALLPADRCRVEGLSLLRVTVADDPLDIAAVVAALRVLVRAVAFGPTTQSIVDAARRRNIPVQRLNAGSLVQLGHGRRQRRIRASVTGSTSLIGAELAGNKDAAKALLAEAGLPVPRGALVASADEAAVEARRLRYPVVVKPLDGNHGRGVTTGLTDEAGVRAAFALAARHGRRAIVEREIAGADHRILVIGGKMVAVAERVPARVIGDGVHSIAALIDIANADPRRGIGHAAVLTRIATDAALRALLERRGATLASVPRAGEAVILRDTANLSTGGTAIDRTDQTHPEIVAIAEQAAAVIGLDIAGIDFLTTDITRPVRETGGAIVEINAAPGFRMHLAPSEGTPRDVAAPVIDLLFPRGSRSRIPVFAITGTNGKSTTARMVARILREAGKTVGMTSTSGIYVDDQLLVAADASGPKSARMVLRNPVVDVAVFETARGGILREGLGYERCDVGAVLNVTADHLGLKGIDTLEDLARVKSIVVRSVARRGVSVLNADDPMTVRMARVAQGTLVWFSASGLGPALVRHVAAGGTAVVRGGARVEIHRGPVVTDLIAVADIPATLGGSAEFNVQNALAATAMCVAHGIAPATIAAGLRAFTTSFADSPGRLNIHDEHGFRVIVDYAHNAAALTALGALIDRMRAQHGRVFGMVSIPGDRRDDDLLDMGRLAAGIFDEVMFREAPDGRGRPAGSINALLSQGALAAGMPAAQVHRLKNEEVATDACLHAAQPGDLVVLMPTDVEGIWNRVVDFRPAGVPERAASRWLEPSDA